MADLGITFPLLLLSATPLAAPVTDATVYSDCARVTRTGTVEVDGRLQVVLPPLPPGANADSVRLEARGGASVETIEIRPAGRGPVPVAEARALLAELERADDAIAQGEREKAVLEKLAGVTSWRPGEEPEDEPEGGGKKRAAKLDPRGWRQGLAFLERFAEQMQGRLAAVEGKLLGLRLGRQDIARRSRALAVGPSVHQLEVVATLSGRGRTKLQLRYDVGQAHWTPRYEVRLDPSGERVAIALGGVVTQTTGEDWEDARLVLSTAIPFAAPAPPRLAAWRLGERERFITTSRTTREVLAAAPAAPPLLAPPSEDARLRRALLEGANGKTAAAPSTDSITRDLDFVDNLPHESRDRIRGGTEGPSRVSAAPAMGPGQLLAVVFDQTGAPLRGVKVVVTAVGGGSATRYSDEVGSVRFVGLAPGAYDLRASAPKLAPVFLRGLRVSEGGGAEATVIMEVESSVEEVKVVEKAPLVSTSAANVKEVYTAEGFEVSGPYPSLGSSSAYEVSTAAMGREQVWLAPPPGYRRPRLAPDAPAVLAGGHDLWFAAPASETVRSGAGERRVALASWSWPVAVERNVYPAVADQAFLVATLASPAPDVLPGGPASLFVGGDPVGAAALKLVAPGERFTLPLGVDRAFQPVRQVSVETHDQGLWWKDEVSRYTVTTEITNPHPIAVHLRIHDQIPVSPDRSVAVALVASEPAASLDAATGTVAWSLALPPGATTTVKLIYTLKRPKGHRLHQ